MNVPALKQALDITRDHLALLRVSEAALLNILGGEPRIGGKSESQRIAEAVLKAISGEPMPEPKSAGVADLPARPEPAPDKRPYRVLASGNGRKAGPLRGWVAGLIDTHGPLTVPEILNLKPDLDKRQVYNLTSSCPWFERVPDLFPATYRLSDKGREEYAKAKAEEKTHDPVA